MASPARLGSPEGEGANDVHVMELHPDALQEALPSATASTREDLIVTGRCEMHPEVKVSSAASVEVVPADIEAVDAMISDFSLSVRGYRLERSSRLVSCVAVECGPARMRALQHKLGTEMVLAVESACQVKLRVVSPRGKATLTLDSGHCVLAHPEARFYISVAPNTYAYLVVLTYHRVESPSFRLPPPDDGDEVLLSRREAVRERAALRHWFGFKCTRFNSSNNVWLEFDGCNISLTPRRAPDVFSDWIMDECDCCYSQSPLFYMSKRTLLASTTMDANFVNVLRRTCVLRAGGLDITVRVVEGNPRTTRLLIVAAAAVELMIKTRSSFPGANQAGRFFFGVAKA
ncbi:conserved hypothetical pox protein-similar to A51R [Squirrelpox virus]|uniref:Protein OPG181 n=1 Tax=Squirrelpox virus TaxID=240426 RepID=Q1HTQ0_9POXV|nr:conserved hypothetical pox protein-similar to A51R [Squirrelpox virus]ABD51486.1 C13L [Squirrelpox virus]CCD83318.1 conserved hypothetical pox protein-similar to A51R [Squirrelpox virus]